MWTMNYVANTPLNGILEDVFIIYIFIKQHIVAYSVLWMQFQGESKNEYLAVVLLVSSDGTTLENIVEL